MPSHNVNEITWAMKLRWCELAHLINALFVEKHYAVYYASFNRAFKPHVTAREYRSSKDETAD
jgi:hypothetical protein